MSTLAHNHDLATPCLEHATVRETQGDTYVLDTPRGEALCRRAAGCLLQPEPGDMVLASVADAASSYILTVLERHSDTPPAVDLAPGTVIRTATGDLTLAAAGTLTVQAANADVAVETTTLTGRALTAQVDALRTVARTVDTVARELTQRLGSLFRHTEEHEECQAGSKRQLVDETYALQAQNAVVTADEDVRIDGELIHMG